MRNSSLNVDRQVRVVQGKKMLYNRGQGTTWDGSAKGRFRGKYCKGKGQRGECCKGEAKSGMCSFLPIEDQVLTTNIRASMNSFSSAHLYLH